MKQQSLFIRFMGDSPVVRVLDYLLTERDLDFCISDLAAQAGVGRTTLYRIWDHLLKNHILLPTRVIGKARLYTLNQRNPAVQKLIELDDLLLKQDLRKRASKIKVAVHV